MQKHLLLFLLSILLPFKLWAQTNYKSGIIVTQQGDTLPGFVNYREWNNNPKEVGFKSTLDAASQQTFTPNNIKYFSVTGYEAYEAFEVTMSMDKVNYREISDVNDTARVTSWVFLKPLVTGDRINLYLYKDKIKERYFILDKAAIVPVELKYQVKMEAGAVVEMPLFRQQLNALALKYQVFTLSPQIGSTSYSKADLLKVVRQINTRNVTDINSRLEKKSKLKFFLGPGINYGTLTYRGNNLITVDRMTASGIDKYQEEVVTHAFGPKFSAGADFAINPEVQRLILKGEISASVTKSETVAYFRYNTFSDKEQLNTYNLSLLTVSAMPQVIYNLYNNDKLRIYLGSGAAFSFYKDNENSLNRRPVGTDKSATEEEISEYLKIKSMGLNFIVRSGVVIKNKIECGLVYLNPAEITTYVSAQGNSAKVKSLSFSVNYLFR